MEYIDYRAYTDAQMDALDSALADYNLLLQKQSKRADYYTSRAQIYKQMGNREAALLDVEQALKLNPVENQALQLKAELNRPASQM